MGNLPSKASLSPLTIPLFARRHHSAVKSPASSSSSTPHLSSRMSDPSHSDGSSNDDTASLSVHTPDDAQSLHLARADTKRSWKSWLPNKRSSSLKHRDRKDKAPVKTPLPDWEPLELPVAPQLLHPAFGASDDDMHTSSVSSFDFVSTADAITAPSQSPTATTPPSPALAFANFSVLIRNSVARTPAQPSPFIQPVSGPIYPRSCNRSHLLSQPSPSLRTLTLKNHLRNRLDDPSSFPLDGATIAALGSRPTPEELPTPLLPDYNIAYPGRSMKILSSSPGIHRWICRPAFEDRFAIFVATEAGVQTKPVSSALAVAALEYSEALDVMVDPDYGLVLDKVLPQSPSESMPPVSSPSATVAEALPMPTIEVSESAPVEVVLPRTSSFITSPSPLRNQHTRDPSEASPVLHEAQSMSTISMSTIRGDTTPQKKAATATTAVKRVVRFAEDDDDEEDGLPLHLLRAKKKREEKAKFLRVEQQRRMREAFEEQKRQEMEALENERKALAAQKEREERDRRLYAEKVRASRLRSEQVRAGSYNINSGSSSSLLVTSPSSAQLREGERNNRASKLYSSKPGETSSPRVDELSSSSSSRPASVRHSSHSLVPPSLPEARSRPPSTYSNTSSEDMRPSSGSRRNSYATSASGSIRSSMAVPYPMYPMWTGSHQSLSPMQMQMPMVPNSFAAFADMPLLPPNAPFMKQSRQSSPSPDSKSRRNSSSQSSERGNLNSSGSPSPATSPSSSKNQQWPNHRRQGSGDSKASKRSSKTMHPQHTGGSTGQQRPHPSSTQSQPNVMRGRPLIPNFSSSPSPWTALPSQNGMMPTAMPVYSQSMPARTRNGTYPGQMGHDWRSSLIT